MATTVGGVTNTAATATQTQDVQSAITDGLNRLNAFSTLPDGEGTVDINQYYGKSTVDTWKAPYADEIKALANKQPPLTAAQAKTEVDSILNRFGDHARFMRALHKYMFMTMMKIVQKTMNMFDAEGNINPSSY